MTKAVHNERKSVRFRDSLPSPEEILLCKSQRSEEDGEQVTLAMDMDVLNMFLIAGGTLALPILAFLASFLLWPSALIKVYYWYWRRTLGLQVRYADTGGYRFCYSVRGKPGPRPSVLMLHGFSTHKDTWLSVVKFLPKHLHLLCVDMPGHEGTTRTCADDYSIQGQVRRIHQFVESIRLNKKPFHLVGTSMGGNVAGMYAACHPAHIFGLTLICPAGLRSPNKSRFLKQLQALEKAGVSQGSPLIPTSPEEMEDMLRLCSHVRFKIPQQILQGLVDVRLPHTDFYKEGELQKNCTVLQTDCAALRSEKTTLQEIMQHLEKELYSSRDQSALLGRSVSVLERTQGELESRLAEQQELHRQDCVRLKAQIDQATHRIKGLQREYEDTQVELVQVKRRCSEVEQEKLSLSEELQQCKDKLRQLQERASRYEDTQVELVQVKRRCSEVEQEKLSLSEELQQCKDKLRQLQERASRYEDTQVELVQVKRRCSEVEQEKLSLSEELQQCKDKLRQLQERASRYEDTQVELVQEKRRCSEVEQEKLSLSEELQQCKDKLRQLQERASRLSLQPVLVVLVGVVLAALFWAYSSLW
ncbi:hypothetical protein SKAU_G00422470 [Synaphobranchus kaupii]|uniref:acylglycerol lipase n=1 Tax=Synaphobranchus kaupii TaxID=118154 RepID=A0A9Q1E6Z4_SYNKA|nr:hypothetical protein SKAU_G00422470 [Synaphobranchus kaupii]